MTYSSCVSSHDCEYRLSPLLGTRHSVLSKKPRAAPLRLPVPKCYLAGDLCLNPKLKATLGDYSCVKAVFSGHGHWHDCIVEGPTLYCQTGALISYPNELRRVRISSDRIDVQVLPLSCGGFPDSSYRPQGGNDWTAGRPQDRCYTHLLPGGAT